MKHFYFTAFFVLTLIACKTENNQNNLTIVATDVHNFWKAYDLVTATSDSATQADILEKEFFEPGTPGLKAIMEARRYTREEYRQVINDYPKFWNSLRKNMLRAPDLANQINQGASKFFSIYPQQLPAEIYFTVGCFRTNGTIVDSLLLIGTELALAGPEVDLSEWPESMDGLLPYMESNPAENLVFLNTHEFVHTQQPTRRGYNLLGQCVFEGVPEFVATLALEQESSTPAIAYGKANDEKVKAVFAEEMGAEYHYSWLQNDTSNPFGTRDLGYYIGYALAEKYYDAAQDKSAAIKHLIELNYDDPTAINQFVDKLAYFDRPVGEYLEAYEARRPRVTHIAQFENNANNVDANLKQITLHFSESLNTDYTNNNLGPLGIDYVLRVQAANIAEDGLSVTYQVSLEAGRKYQLTLGSGYRTEDDRRLIPYTLTFSTQ
ncbi:MAG: hypothetical protein AB8H12_12235 [Lewinella sp.]